MRRSKSFKKTNVEQSRPTRRLLSQKLIWIGLLTTQVLIKMQFALLSQQAMLAKTMPKKMSGHCLFMPGHRDCDSVLFPLWKLGQLDPKKLSHIFETCLAVFVEGGYPRRTRPKYRGGTQLVIENLVTSRSHKSASCFHLHWPSGSGIQKAVDAIRSELSSVCALNDFQQDLLASSD